MQRSVLDLTSQVPALEPSAARDDVLPAVFLVVVAIVFGALLIATTGAAPSNVPAEEVATFVTAA